MRKALLISLLACVGVVPAMAQPTLPLLNQAPGNLHWYRLRTAHFQVLYPQGFEQAAQRTARRLEQVYLPVSASLERPPRRLSVVLQNQTTNSNGFATLTPRRTEFYTTPPQDPSLAGTLDWLDLLSVHEFRHIVQYEKALQGLSKLAYGVAGYGGLSLMTLGVPDWFFEGDAVGTETVLTRNGRGRIPNFDLGMRANLLAGRRFSYSKAVAGSYRDNVPNHYVLGYFLTTYAKRHTDPNVWSGVLNRYYNFPVYPFSFSNGLKQGTGLTVEKLYQRTLNDLDSTWHQQQQHLTLTPATAFRVAANPKIFTEYQYPQYVNDSTVLAVKTGLGDISQLVLLSRDGQERRAFVQGLVNDPGMLSVGGDKVCWPEYGLHTRWSQKIYSELRVLDLTTGHLTRLTTKSRYTAAALSPDGTKLIAVRSDSAYHNQLVVLDARTGQPQRVLPNPAGDFYQQPRWGADQRTVAVVTLKPAGKTIELVDTETGQRRAVLPVTNTNLSQPQPWGNYVLYSSPQSGIDNLYAVEISSGRAFQVSSRPLAAYHAAVSPDGQRLAFQDFRVEGSRVAEMPLVPAKWQPATNQPAAPVGYAEPLVNQDEGARLVGAVLPDSIPGTQPLPAERYRRLPHALNAFGWGLVQTPSGQGVTLGVRSQDLLSTTQAVAGVSYDQVERTTGYSADVSYQGWFPVLDAGFSGGQRRTNIPTADGFINDKWSYNRFTAGVRLPLALTRSKYQQTLSLGAYYSGEQVRGYDSRLRYRDQIGNNSLHALNYTLSYYHVLKQSYRDVAPRWGQVLSASFRNTPFSTGLQAQQWAVTGGMYFPGLLKHHSIRVRGGYQRQQQNSYNFSTATIYPRGEGYVSYDRLRAGSFEYRMPIADMHLALGRWLYIQRLKGAGFFDLATGQSKVIRPTDGQQFNVQRYSRTTGLDLSFVFNVLRLRTPFEAGARTIYNVRTGSWEVQPLVLDIGF
ncbi:hypothetical protein FHG12_10760 [Hymenobacter jejuensis]|uniref:Uncharacterized protein n=2 Tax=Hymenobacter jejuensis TaxID=2502781 RepID=A0A5B8A730_9BACT|nr:hypothetical protein FHG12_10760 [Hymenobacter jejuensis]